jgi:hypothetical protein
MGTDSPRWALLTSDRRLRRTRWIGWERVAMTLTTQPSIRAVCFIRLPSEGWRRRNVGPVTRLSFEEIWQRIAAYAGHEFQTVRGGSVQLSRRR